MLLAAVIIQYLRTKQVPLGYLLSMVGLFCAALTRFPSMQNDAFFWCTIGLFGVSTVVSVGEFAMRYYRRNHATQVTEGHTPAAAVQ